MKFGVEGCLKSFQVKLKSVMGNSEAIILGSSSDKGKKKMIHFFLWAIFKIQEENN